MNARVMNVKVAGTAGSDSRPAAPVDPAPPHIAARGVAVDFRIEERRQRVLNDINLIVPKGSFVSLIGPSGCGKSTLLKVMAGLIAPSEGDMRVAGLSPQEAVKARLIGLVFQPSSVRLPCCGWSGSMTPTRRCRPSFPAVCVSGWRLRERSPSIRKSC